jgi:hypothetical protein
MHFCIGCRYNSLIANLGARCGVRSGAKYQSGPDAISTIAPCQMFSGWWICGPQGRCHLCHGAAAGRFYRPALLLALGAVIERGSSALSQRTGQEK